MALVYLGLGSNLGNGIENLNRSLDLLNRQVGTVKAVSAYVESEPWGFESEHRFTNAVCALETSLDPMQLLDETQAVERQMGRTHKHGAGESYTDRIIDIDILMYDAAPWENPCRKPGVGLFLKSERLTLPHPLIFEREFVWGPLADCYKRLLATQSE